MAVESGMEFSDLSELVKEMYRTAEEVYPDQAKKFLKAEGNKGRRKLRERTKAVTEKKTGNLLKGIRRSGVQKHDGDFQIRVYNKAPHAHLIEHGHVLWVNGKKTERFVPGRHPAAETTKVLKQEFPKDAEAFVDELIKEGFEL